MTKLDPIEAKKELDKAIRLAPRGSVFEAIGKERHRRQRVTAILVGVMVLVGFAFWRSGKAEQHARQADITAAHNGVLVELAKAQAETAQQSVRQTCEAGNESRAGQRELWIGKEGIVSIIQASPPNPMLSPEERQRQRRGLALFVKRLTDQVTRTFAPRDCAKLFASPTTPSTEWH